LWCHVCAGKKIRSSRVLVLSHLMWKPPGIQQPTVLMDLQPEILNVLITISHPFEPFDFIVEPL